MVKRFILIVFIVGYDRAGKSTAAQIISNQCGIPVLELGDRLRLMQERRPELSRDTSVALEELRKEDPDIALTLLGERQPPSMIIPNIRDIRDFQVLTDRTEQYVTIAVRSSFTSRSTRRSRVTSQEELLSRDRRHAGWGLEAILDLAEVGIDNDTTLDHFVHEVENRIVPYVKGVLRK